MQNEELRRTREELELSRNTYAELYDFAPVGYLTFDAPGLIQEVNLAGAQLLGTERQLLINTPFPISLPTQTSGRFFPITSHLVVQRHVMLKCDQTSRERRHADPCSTPEHLGRILENKGRIILTSIIDGTVRKQLEEKLQNSP